MVVGWVDPCMVGLGSIGLSLSNRRLCLLNRRTAPLILTYLLTLPVNTLNTTFCYVQCDFVGSGSRGSKDVWQVIHSQHTQFDC